MFEFLAWNGKGGAKGLEEYQNLLKRFQWLQSRIRGRATAMMDASDSMSVFDESEHEDPQYLKYLKEYQEADSKKSQYEDQLEEVGKILMQYII